MDKIAETPPDFQTLLDHWDIADAKLDPKQTYQISYQEGRITLVNSRDFLDNLPEVEGEKHGQIGYQEIQSTGLLGEGGMGVVELAVQNSLSREVAIKKLKQGTESYVQSLLWEAFVTGHLEHPNIIPVYLLGKSTDDKPIIVMKKIDGVTWKELMHNPKHSLRAGNKGHYEWNFQVLLSILNALEFAHEKGFVHRDLKPENVMIGQFGEIYLLDWGIAVCKQREEPFPLKYSDKNTSGLAGTPAYMAPEMLEGNIEKLDKRTDIFILGSILQEIITGNPPYVAGTLHELLYKVYCVERAPLPQKTDGLLRNMVNKAMHEEKGKRYQSIAEFRQALEFFLRVQKSVVFTREANDSLVSEVPSLFDSKNNQRERNKAFQQTFHRSRFRLEEALNIWPGNQEAMDLLHFLKTVRFFFEVEQVRYENALRIYSEIEHPESFVEKKRKEIANKLEEKKLRLAELMQIKQETNYFSGLNTRKVVASVFLLGTALLALPFSRSLGFVERHIDNFLPLSICVLLLVIITLYWGRASLLRTQLSKKMTILFAMFAVSLEMLFVLDCLAKAPLRMLPAKMLVITFLWLACMFVLSEKPMYLMLGIYTLVEFFLILVFKDYSFDIVFIFALGALGGLLYFDKKPITNENSEEVG